MNLRKKTKNNELMKKDTNNEFMKFSDSIVVIFPPDHPNNGAPIRMLLAV